ncbi:TPA: hypothetical protein DDW69_02185 [candidate division CPR2 bacterium]|uniref:Segregation and condensation protein A n=1 Tax=candidate division CPR2 bacterium GW2011_GWC1_41_48 TaxID=1618344 RepID=A0A0G0WA32_UNCC2|nr:MAG: Segregation and condensation protein A [candidate division CPR2 bacterium GW2011_GWC2_39_35]KKR28004.1 MAG: Segregation and condensation protein A [candidate division CPR2 bacterium GW2011_GWD2_39_7]KKS09835.1 MAG: Chromosome segregation and condensation protein ScpA [candidate division CPR2 bacterium GW2011_GWC1_41_48]OGB72099.1 MAG: hypothetical protein A2Y26_05015 [candidate division CPR2 bacterium GWD2_39_7]HBG81628.1 hypothetical protein [candidate division CPR2 bacterium]
MIMTYTIKILQFEGPLDLLLQLTLKEKLEITEVSLSKITEEYLTYIDKFKVNAGQLAEFLNISSKLLYLKSRALLPSVKTEEEEEDIEKLKDQLEEYKRYKEAAKKLHEILNKKEVSFATRGKSKFKNDFFEPPSADAKILLEIFKSVLNKMPDPEKLPEKSVIKQVTLEEKYAEIESILKKNKTIELSAILKEMKSKIEIVITFLAILEMVKQKVVVVKQSSNFSEVSIIKV